MKTVRLFLAMLLPLSCAGAQVNYTQDLSTFFGQTKGAFVLYDLNNDRYIRYNEKRCRERFSPKSTFKIPNSLIGLETGVIKDAEFVIPWDRQKYPPQQNWNTEPFIHWAKDHTLRSAIKHSVVWYYREIALRAGHQKMQKYLNEFSYGNQRIGGRVDEFWLDNSLKISADEQVEFLKALYAEKLPISKRSIGIVKDILLLEQTPAYRLSAKTGGGPIAEGKVIGWFIGYVETGGNIYFFATNIEGPTYMAIRDRRIEITKQILTGLGYLPKQ
jgi:beta-lactamase class D